MTLDSLSDNGKEELALALVLWHDFKLQGKFDAKVCMQALELADMLKVKVQYETLLKKLLAPFKITLT
jgi:hypothetical protein